MRKYLDNWVLCNQITYKKNWFYCETFGLKNNSLNTTMNFSDDNIDDGIYLKMVIINMEYLLKPQVLL
jgi:hypothetical protein